MNETPTPQDQTELIFNCNTCHDARSGSDITKVAIDFNKNVDGTLSPGTARFSVFCAKCQNFLGVIDPDASARLEKMIDPPTR